VRGRRGTWQIGDFELAVLGEEKGFHNWFQA
jgi:hypothetical protein